MKCRYMSLCSINSANCIHSRGDPCKGWCEIEFPDYSADATKELEFRYISNNFACSTKKSDVGFIGIQTFKLFIEKGLLIAI